MIQIPCLQHKIKLTIRSRINILIAMVGVGIAGILLLGQFYVREILFEKETEQLYYLVQTVHSFLSDYEKQVVAGTLTIEEAQKNALHHISSMHYKKDGYFFVSNTKSKILAHPIKELIGVNLYDDKDAKGEYYFRNIVDAATKKGKGTATYYWPPGHGQLKLSSVMSFPKWGWVIGSGTYLDNIEEIALNFFIHISFVAILFLIFMVTQALMMGHAITNAISNLSSILKRIASGDLNVEMTLNNCNDEIGEMEKTVNALLVNARNVAEIEKRKEDLEQTKRELISVVSHELRTPVSAIRGSLSLALGTMEEDISEQLHHILTIAHNNCDRLMLLVNDLLDVDKTAAGQMTVAICPEYINPILKTATENNQPYAEKYNVIIEYNPLEKDITIETDRSRLLQVLSNFLSNAAKFSPAGAVIHLTAKVTDDNKVRISIIDHGLGIPKDFQDKLFQKFSQADTSASRKKCGTGLGLHISKSLIELMNGKVGFESTEGFGTTFWVEFSLETKGDTNAST